MSTPEPQRISPKKLEANRRNAQRSTGPRTAAGKDRSKRNAFKHGLTAKEVLITAGDGKENKREYEQLLAGFRDYFRPVGLPQALLVDEIAICFWKKKRAHRFETGAIRDHADTLRWNHEQSLKSDLEYAKQSAEILMGSSVGLDYLLDGLRRAKEEVRQGGLSGELRNFLDKYFEFAISKAHVTVGETQDEVSAEKDGVQLLTEIALEQAALQTLKKRVQENEELQLDAALRRAALPDAAALGRLLRYVAANDKQLTRLLEQLGQLQARDKAAVHRDAAGGAIAAG